MRYRLPPHPPIPALAQTFACWWRPLRYLEYCRGRFGDRFTIHSPSQPPLVFLADPQELRTVFRAPPHTLCPGEGGAAIMPIVGERSFMLREGDEHLWIRRSLTDAFHASRVAEHTEPIREVIEREVSTWPTDQPIRMHPRLRALTLEVILRTLFERSQLADDLLFELRDLILSMLSVTSSLTLIQPYMRYGPRGRRIWKRFLEDRRKTDELLHTLIAARRDQGHDEQATDALGVLLRTGNPDGSAATTEQVRDNLMSLILAGHETTSAELSWAFLLLAHNRGVQHRLQHEIDEGVHERYLTATVQEVLRHRPVFLFAIPRAVKARYRTAHCEYRPPAHLLGCIYLVHHDPGIYEDPSRFSPERFLECPPRPQTWLPWGGGRKRCLGLHVATLEMKLVLHCALQRFTVEPIGSRLEAARWRSVIVAPANGARIILRERTSPQR